MSYYLTTQPVGKWYYAAIIHHVFAAVNLFFEIFANLLKK